MGSCGQDGLTAGQGILGKVRCCRGAWLDGVTDRLERGVLWSGSAFDSGPLGLREGDGLSNEEVSAVSEQRSGQVFR